MQEEHRLQVEIKILQALCSLLRPSIPLFQAAHKNLLFLDALNATALWATEHNCHFAFENSAFFKHGIPYLGPTVPIDIVFQKIVGYSLLRGQIRRKTVSLKTIALFSLLNQAGFPILHKKVRACRIFLLSLQILAMSNRWMSPYQLFCAHEKYFCNALCL